MIPEARLAEIEERLKKRIHQDWEEYNAVCFPNYIKKDFALIRRPFAVLEAVLAIHQRVDPGLCGGCRDAWPCLTRQAITETLGEVEE